MSKDKLNSVPAIFLSILLMGPVFSLIFTAFESNQDLWVHLIDTVLPIYVINTLMLFIGVLFLSAVLAFQLPG